MILTSTTEFSAPRSTQPRAARFWDRLGEMMTAYTNKRARTDEIARLEAMTDAELAALGLARDRIVLHVFRDIAWV